MFVVLAVIIFLTLCAIAYSYCDDDVKPWDDL